MGEDAVRSCHVYVLVNKLNGVHVVPDWFPYLHKASGLSSNCATKSGSYRDADAADGIVQVLLHQAGVGKDKGRVVCSQSSSDYLAVRETYL